MHPIDYDTISQTYDDVREADVILLNHFLQELPSRPALNVLDIGCGTGNYTDRFQRLTQAQGYRFYGLDPSEGMLSKARQKNKDIVFWQGAADHIPAGDIFFDFAYMTDVIHHVPDIRRMFAEIQRILKPQGRLCIVTQSHAQIDARPIVRFFPGTARVDKERYPEIDAIIAAGQSASLTYLKQEVLFSGDPVELGADYLELARKKGYSMLRLLSELEYQTGLHDLEIALKDGPIQARLAGETLIWFELFPVQNPPQQQAEHDVDQQDHIAPGDRF